MDDILARKSIFKQVMLVKKAIIEISNLRLSKLTSRVKVLENCKQNLFLPKKH